MPKDKWIPTIKPKCVVSEIKKAEPKPSTVLNPQKIIKISGLKKIQLLKTTTTLPEKVKPEPKTENIENVKNLGEHPQEIKKKEQTKYVIPSIQSNKMKSIALHSGITIKMKKETINEPSIKIDNSKIIIPKKVVTSQNIIKLTTPINTFKNISMTSLVPHQPSTVPNSPAIKISNIRLTNTPVKVLSLPCSTAKETCTRNEPESPSNSKSAKEQLNIESKSNAKTISVISSSGKKITLTPIPIVQKNESDKKSPSQRFVKINPNNILPSTAEKRSIQFIPVGYQPPLKITRLAINEDKRLTLAEMVDIINKNYKNNRSVPQLAIEFKCSQNQVQQIISNHHLVMMDRQKHLENPKFVPKDAVYRDHLLYKMILEKIVVEWYSRSKCTGKSLTDKNIVEKGFEVIDLFDNPGLFSSQVIAVKGWPSKIRNSISNKEYNQKSSKSVELIDIIFDLKAIFPSDLYMGILEKIGDFVEEESDDPKQNMSYSTGNDQSNETDNGIFIKDLREDISTYEDAYIHLLALIKFCKSIGHVDSIEHLHNLKDFFQKMVVEEISHHDD